ncbi:MAG: GNAT family N-acetyltransferase [Gemmatimonadaceae bacterium]
MSGGTPPDRVPIVVRQTTPADFPGIIALTQATYPGAPTWREEQLASHLRVFPEGQFVAVRRDTGEIVGMAASLIVLWDDYALESSWRDFTARGHFSNHDPVRGRTLYGAEIMVSPALQGQGVGSQLYAAREALARTLGLLRIRAGARLRDYHRFADRMSAEEYAAAVVRGEIVDRTLTFQLRRGFRVIGVVSSYLRHDPESLGHAAVIEWVNPDVAEREGYRIVSWPNEARP